MVERPDDKNQPEQSDHSNDFDTEINASLDEVLDLMALEVERLKTALENYRLSDREDKEQLIRWHIQQIDERQDRLDELKEMILQGDDSRLH